MNKTVIARVTNFSGFLKDYMRMSFSEKMLMLLYLFALVRIIYLILYGINSRIGLSSINEILPSIVLMSLTLLSIGQLRKELKWWDVVLFVALGVGYIYSPRVYPDTAFDVYMRAPTFLLTVLPFYIIGSSMDIKKHSNVISQIGRLGVIITLFLTLADKLFGLSMDFFGQDESMGQAYLLLVPLIIEVWNELRKPNGLDFILCFTGLIILLGFGTRGPVLSLVIFVVLFFFIKTKSVGTMVILILIGVLLVIFIDPIASFLGSILSVFGMSERVLDDIKNINGAESSGRDNIWEVTLDRIRANGAEGEGLYADRSFIIIGDEGTYVHNFFLEVGINYGMYIAFVISIVVVFLFISNLRKTRGTEYLIILIAFFCFGFLPLLVSDSYLEAPMFWLFLGVCMKIWRTPRQYFLSKE